MRFNRGMKIYGGICIVLWVVLSLLACIPEEVQFEGDINAMNLYELAPGDSFRFVLLTGENYREGSGSDYQYTGDTLLLEVLGFSDGKYVIKEHITRGSNMFNAPNGDYYWLEKDSVFINFWEVREDSLLISPTRPGTPRALRPRGKDEFLSHLMFTHSIPFVNSQNLEELEFRGWKTSYPYMTANKLFRVSHYRLFETDYRGLTVFINNRPMSNDAPGRTFAYDRVQGVVRTSIYSWWSRSGIGWDRLD